MPLETKIKLKKISFEIPQNLKERIDALSVDANAAGLKFNLSAAVLSFMTAEVGRDEKALKKRTQIDQNDAQGVL